eukprot:SAG31_NODE_4672_length_3044_cov_3.919525_2_plen_112_part_00
MHCLITPFHRWLRSCSLSLGLSLKLSEDTSPLTHVWFSAVDQQTCKCERASENWVSIWRNSRKKEDHFLVELQICFVLASFFDLGDPRRQLFIGEPRESRPESIIDHPVLG